MKMGNCVITLACVKKKINIWQKGGYKKPKRKGKKLKRKKLLNGHFWQLNGTDRGNECRKMFFFFVLFDREVKYA